MAEDGLSFRSARTGNLGEAELGPGAVTVCIERDALLLVGATGRRFALPFRSIARLRFARRRGALGNPTRRRYYRVAIWKDIEGPPMILGPDWKEVEAYREVMRQLAQGVWAGRHARVEKGVSWAAAARSSVMLFAALTFVLYSANSELRWNLSYVGQAGALLGLALISSLTTWFDQSNPRAIDGAKELEWLLKI